MFFILCEQATELDLEQYEGSVEAGKGDWRAQRQASIVIKKDLSPNFHHLFTFPIVAAKHSLTVSGVPRHGSSLLLPVLRHSS